MAILGRTVTALTAGLAAWRTYGVVDTLDPVGDPARRRLRLAFLASLYDGSAYSGDAGDRYRKESHLYAETRPIVNRVKPLCDFYATHLYAGPISPDGEMTFQGHDAAVPLLPLVGDETEEADLRRAFGQLYQWWAWTPALAHRVRQTAILGTTLTEIVDEPATGKVMPSLVWPGYVDDITLDAVGNVKGYALEFRVTEPGAIDRKNGRRADGDSYLFRKVVDGQSFRRYKDDVLVSEEANPYGFVPAIWDRHGLGWGAWGEPAIFGSQAAADETNELLSHAGDRLHHHFSAPIVFTGTQQIAKLDLAPSGRQYANLIGGAGPVSTLDLDIGQVDSVLARIDAAIADECPELRFYSELRGMSSLTGPGAARALGDVVHRVNTAAALYDQQTLKLLQMATAIAGWRIANGDWAEPLTEQQRKFVPFGVDSFKAGHMDAVILPRDLVKPTYLEQIAEQEAIERLQDRASFAALGMPDEEIADRLDRRREAVEAEAAATAARFAAGAFAEDGV